LKKAHASQLYRYFTVTSARFGILTNGIEYQFFADLDKQNVMDDKPFLVVDMRQVSERTALQLKKFTKSVFNVDEILSSASELKYRLAIISIMNEQLKNPSEKFVRFFADQIYSGRITQTVIKDFSNIIQQAIGAFIGEKVDERLKTALESGSEQKPPEPTIEERIEPDTKIITTQEELDGYFIIKSILREIADPRRVTMRDAQSYCSVLCDDNRLKPLARMYFNRSQKYIGLFAADRDEDKIAIKDVDEIYQYADRIKEAMSRYL
jgi:predicted type IV restriction endonuclease